MLGRSDGFRHGDCYIKLTGETTTCTKADDPTFDVFDGIPRIPSKVPFTCTHLSSKNDVKAVRDACEAITDKDVCQSDDNKDKC